MTDEIAEEILTILNSLSRKRQSLLELNDRLLETLPNEELEDEISKTFQVDCKIRQAEKLTENFLSHEKQNTKIQSTLNANAECFTSEICDNISSNKSAALNSHVPLPATNVNYGLPVASVDNRLPKLDLPLFHGDILEWNTFWDTYESTINQNYTLTPI
jgi:hypothetical protein